MKQPNPTSSATLLSWTRLPMETIYSVWESSKTREPLRTPDQIKAEVDPDEVRDLFRRVIAQRIPVAEHVDLVFMVEDISISWREQAVRHRIGTKASPERLGIDIVPDLHESSWWSQSMTIMDMGTFASEGRYRLPDFIKGTEHEQGYHETMLGIERMYNTLVEAGIPREDAREMIPLGAQHRMSWKINIAALQHILNKRSCWIMQLGVWGPVITSMIKELATKVDPIFHELAKPPCIKLQKDGNDKFTGCVLMEECARRLSGDDEMAPCPLHLYHHWAAETPGAAPALRQRMLDGELETFAGFVDVPLKDLIRKRTPIYKDLWGRNVFSGERLK